MTRFKGIATIIISFIKLFYLFVATMTRFKGIATYHALRISFGDTSFMVATMTRFKGIATDLIASFVAKEALVATMTRFKGIATPPLFFFTFLFCLFELQR